MSWLSEQNLSSAPNSRVPPERTQKPSCSRQMTLRNGSFVISETNLRPPFHIKRQRRMLTGNSCQYRWFLWLNHWNADDGLTKGQHSSFQKFAQFCWIYLTFLCTTTNIHEWMVHVSLKVWYMAFFICRISHILEFILEIYCDLCPITTLIPKSFKML